MKRESTVPATIKPEHVGLRVLYRLPNQAIVMEGIIDGLSPEGLYIHIGKRWVENGVGAILSVLPGSQRRRDSIIDRK